MPLKLASLALIVLPPLLLRLESALLLRFESALFVPPLPFVESSLPAQVQAARALRVRSGPGPSLTRGRGLDDPRLRIGIHATAEVRHSGCGRLCGAHSWTAILRQGVRRAWGPGLMLHAGRDRRTCDLGTWAYAGERRIAFGGL